MDAEHCCSNIATHNTVSAKQAHIDWFVFVGVALLGPAPLLNLAFCVSSKAFVLHETDYVWSSHQRTHTHTHRQAGTKPVLVNNNGNYADTVCVFVCLTPHWNNLHY